MNPEIIKQINKSAETIDSLVNYVEEHLSNFEKAKTYLVTCIEQLMKQYEICKQNHKVTEEVNLRQSSPNTTERISNKTIQRKSEDETKHSYKRNEATCPKTNDFHNKIEEINNKVEKMQEEWEHTRSNGEHNKIQDEVQSELNQHHSRIDKCETSIKRLEKEVRNISPNIKSRKQENNTCKRNVVIFGIKDIANEKTWDVGTIVTDIFEKHLNLKLTQEHFQDTYRLGHPKSKNRPILVRFTNMSTKNKVMTKKKLIRDNTIHIEHDYPLSQRVERRKLLIYLKQAKKQNIPATLVRDRLRLLDNTFSLTDCKESWNSILESVTGTTSAFNTFSSQAIEPHPRTRDIRPATINQDTRIKVNARRGNTNNCDYEPFKSREHMQRFYENEPYLRETVSNAEYSAKPIYYPKKSA